MKILSLSGFVPEQICDTIRFTQYDGERGISHYCGYVSDYISQVLNDSTIDGAVFPKSCDSTRVIPSYLMESGKFVYQIPVPCNADDYAVNYLAANIKQYKSAVEAFFAVSLTDADVKERISLVNERNRRLRDAYNGLGNTVLYSEYLKMVHKLLGEPLSTQEIPEKLRNCDIHGKRVYVVGSFLSNYKVIDMIEQAGMRVVGDNLPESKRIAFAPNISIEGDIYINIAAGMLLNHVSPTQNRFSEILSKDFEEIEKKKVAGVIYITQKYCEPYDYLYYIYKRKMDEVHIPVLKIDFANSSDNRRLEFELEAFSELI